MAVVSTATLKGYFNTGDTPTEAQYIDLIDTLAIEIRKIDPDIVVNYKSIFRINRDIRFSKDKRPYKTYLSAAFAFDNATALPNCLSRSAGRSDLPRLGNSTARILGRILAAGLHGRDHAQRENRIAASCTWGDA